MSGKILLLAVVMLSAAACEKKTVDDPAAAGTTPTVTADQSTTVVGNAEVKDADGKVLGTIDITQTTSGLSISGTITGLAAGEYGMHLHSVGLCEGPEFKSAGSHWNPTNKMHGTTNPAGWHLGDLPNLVVAAGAPGVVQGATMGGTFAGGDNALMDADGAAIVIHAAPDDYKTDPSGNSGARVACGVIVAK